MTRPKIVFALPLPDHRVTLEPDLDAEMVLCSDHSPESVAREIGDADVLIARGPARLGREVLERGKRLAVISTVGSGADCIDLTAATALRIPVTNGAGVAPNAVVEYTLAALVLANRDILRQHHELLDGTWAERWSERHNDIRARELDGLHLGIVGLGFIGSEVARRAAAAFGVQIAFVDPFLPPGPTDQRWTRLETLDELLSWADVVTLHLPLTDATRGLIGARELELLGTDGALINTARGGLVDQEAVLDALRQGRLRGAVLDVFEAEPPSRSDARAFASAPGLLATPHLAGVTRESMRALSRSAIERALGVLRGERPDQLLNPEIWEERRTAGSP